MYYYSMKNKFVSLYKKLPPFIRSGCKVLQRFCVCLKDGKGFASVKIFWKVLNRQSIILVDEYYQQTESLDVTYPKKIERLRSLTHGLHSILSNDKRFSYSVLIPLDNPSPKNLKETLKSVLELTAPDLEILVGYKRSESNNVLDILNEFPQIKMILCPDTEKIINRLAEESKGNFLFLMGQEDAVRCDILFRYEQILRMSKTDDLVLYCKEHENNRSYLKNIPYLFSQVEQHSLLIPKHLWEKTGGLKSNMEIFDLVLKLDLVGAQFLYFPLQLYHNRGIIKKCDHQEGIRLLQNYAKQKGLYWTYHSGYTPESYRAIPILEETPKVHVIIPFKNQKELTLKAVESVLRQKGIHQVITAVDNGSEDHSIATELEKMGVEVFHIQEPFNYSRLNNLAVKKSKWQDDYDHILFLNNDVELEEGAIEEMARWISQPGIGIVGCRLHYPNGLLQHGGVYREYSHKMVWDHLEKMLEFSQLKITNVLGVVDGVTAACALMKKRVFNEVGGFDEIWYPICFSDTTLAEKLKAKGYLCFYTPYAAGIHHESISRNLNNIEDVETSLWFYERWCTSSNFIETRQK